MIKPDFTKAEMDEAHYEYLFRSSQNSDRLRSFIRDEGFDPDDIREVIEFDRMHQVNRIAGIHHLRDIAKKLSPEDFLAKTESERNFLCEDAKRAVNNFADAMEKEFRIQDEAQQRDLEKIALAKRQERRNPS